MKHTIIIEFIAAFFVFSYLYKKLTLYLSRRWFKGNITLVNFNTIRSLYLAEEVRTWMNTAIEYAIFIVVAIYANNYSNITTVFRIDILKLLIALPVIYDLTSLYILHQLNNKFYQLINESDEKQLIFVQKLYPKLKSKNKISD